MIGLLDPALFLPRDAIEVEQDLDLIVQICRKHNIKIVPLPGYWNDLWSTLARHLEKQLSPEAKRSVQELRKLGDQSKIKIQSRQTQAGKVWRKGFKQLFGADFFSESWEERMMLATLQALASGHDVIMLTRKVSGRNIQQHASGECILDEITRWVLHVQPKGMGHRQIRCVYHPRNMHEKWTARFDWRLPAASDGGSYPFCPPDQWWKASTQAHRTIRGKPAWIDKLGNGWTRPNIPDGAGYHWDVFIESHQLQETVGLDQINVVEFGAPTTEGNPGQIHHVPKKKQGKPTGTGWTC